MILQDQCGSNADEVNYIHVKIKNKYNKLNVTDKVNKCSIDM